MPLAPMIGPDAVAQRGGTQVRSPKTAELVAGTLRRMVVDGQLTDGDFLPNEAELMAHFGVSRPTLRVLAKYSPEYPCLLAGLRHANSNDPSSPGEQAGVQIGRAHV